jgi:hypothetical protein
MSKLAVLDLRELARRRIANGTVAANTLRRQRAAGIIDATRYYLRLPNVFGRLESLSDSASFGSFLDTHTCALLKYWRTNPNEQIDNAERRLSAARIKDGKSPRRPLDRSRIGSWAAARKCLNIYVLSARLSSEVGWPGGKDIHDDWLELPIDGKVVTALIRDGHELQAYRAGMGMPNPAIPKKVPTLDGLNRDLHEEYQQLAREIGRARGIPRAFLDLAYYEPG